MFDQDELEELREDRYQWQGHVRRDVRVEKNTRFSGRALFSSMGASAVVAVALVAMVLSSNMTMALVGISGIGGFGATIDRLEGQDVEIYPGIGPTASCDSPGTNGEFAAGDGDEGHNIEGLTDNTLPQLRADITDAEVPTGSNITFYKDIEVPIPDLDMIRISIGQQSGEEQGNVTLGNASLYVTSLKAGHLQAFDTEIREGYSDGSPANPRFGDNGEFVVTGTAQDSSNLVVIEDAEARAHFLGFEQLMVPFLTLDIEYYQDRTTATPDPVVSDNAACPY